MEAYDQQDFFIHLLRCHVRSNDCVVTLPPSTLWLLLLILLLCGIACVWIPVGLLGHRNTRFKALSCLVYHFSPQNDIKPQKYHYFGLVSIERFRNFMLILERTLIILLCWDRCGVESKWYVAYNVLPMLPFPTTAVWTSVSERKKQPDFYLTFEVQVRSKQIFNHIYIWGSSFPLP